MRQGDLVVGLSTTVDSCELNCCALFVVVGELNQWSAGFGQRIIATSASINAQQSTHNGQVALWRRLLQPQQLFAEQS